MSCYIFCIMWAIKCIHKYFVLPEKAHPASHKKKGTFYKMILHNFNQLVTPQIYVGIHCPYSNLGAIVSSVTPHNVEIQTAVLTQVVREREKQQLLAYF